MSYVEMVSFIEEELKDDFDIVYKPDVSYLTLTPDFLIGSKGEIIGLFVLRLSTTAALHELLARLGLSRLGLPTHMRCVLVTDELKFDNKTNEVLEYNFHHIIDFRQISKQAILRFLNTEPSSKINEVPKNIREERFMSMDAFFDYNLMLADNDENFQKLHLDLNTSNDNHRLVEVSKWILKTSDSRAYSRTNQIKHYSNGLIAQRDFSNKSAIIGKINQLIVTTTRLQYNLDSGVLYPNRNAPRVRLLNVGKVPLVDHELRRLLKVASFSGWVVSSFHSWDQVEAVYADFSQYIDNILSKSSGTQKSQWVADDWGEDY